MQNFVLWAAIVTKYSMHTFYIMLYIIIIIYIYICIIYYYKYYIT